MKDLNEDEIDFYLESLQRVELVRATEINLEEDGSTEQYGGLTPEGIKVVHDREMTERQETATGVVGFFTFALALTAIIQAAVSYSQVEDTIAIVALGGALIGALAILVLGGWRILKGGWLSL